MPGVGYVNGQPCISAEHPRAGLCDTQHSAAPLPPTSPQSEGWVCVLVSACVSSQGPIIGEQRAAHQIGERLPFSDQTWVFDKKVITKAAWELV